MSDFEKAMLAETKRHNEAVEAIGCKQLELLGKMSKEAHNLNWLSPELR